MFQRHKTLEEMRDEYSAERVELAVILEDLVSVDHSFYGRIPRTLTEFVLSREYSLRT